MEIRLFDKQQEAFDDTSSKIVLIIAGKRAAKTTTGAIKLLSNIQSNINKGIHENYLCVGPTYGVLRRATIPTLLKYLDPRLGIYKKSDSCVELCDGYKLFIISADEENRIEGFQALDCWFDEAGMCSRTSFEKIWQRTTPAFGKERGQIIITTTPYSIPSSWLNKDFIEKRHSLKYIGYYNWKTSDNPYMADESALAKAMMHPQIYQRDYEGIYVNITGLIYPDFDRAVDVIKPIDVPAHFDLYAGLDAGFSDPCSIVIIAKDHASQEYWLIDSYYKSKGDLDEYAEFINKYPALKEIRYDPSAVALMNELKKKIPKFNFQPADNSVSAGIARCTPLFRDHRLKIFNTNVSIIEDLESYIYDEGKNKPKHTNSHGPDSIRYCFMGNILTARPRKGAVPDLTAAEFDELMRKSRAMKNPLDANWGTGRKTNITNKDTGITYIPIEGLED